MKMIKLLRIVPCLAVCSSLQAQIITDGSVGAQISFDGIDVEINEELGTRSGNNLFHSFETFGIGTRGTATFTGASDINNVISRVTGGEVSTIQGVLRSEVGNADFYFINPAGVTFSSNGDVDVPASFHLSTAKELRFTDGSIFSVNSNASSELSMAAPEAFGFLGNDSGSIELEGTSILIKSSTLSAHSILLSNAGVETTAAGGALRVAAVGEVPVIFNLETGPEGQLEGSLVLSDGSIIGTDGFSNESPGDVQVSAGSLLISGQSGISSIANSGSAGSVEVTITDLATIQNGGSITSRTLSEGDSGNVLLNAGQLLIEGFSTGIFTVTEAFAGNSGNVDVNIAGTATILNGGLILSDTFGEGDAGNVQLTAEQLLIDAQGSIFDTGIFSEADADAGNAGSVEVKIAETATIQNGGAISVTATGGDAGNVQLTARQLLIDGQGSAISEDFTAISPSFSSDFTGIFSETRSSSGNAGSVEVVITELATVQNGVITTSTFAEGDAGAIQLSAGQLLMVDGVVSSDTKGSGNAGSVEVNITDLATIQNGGLMSSSTFSEGDSGNVQLTAGQLLIDGQGSVELFTGISGGAQLGSTGNGGSVEVTITDLATIQNGGEISSSTFSEGDAGVVKVSAGQLLIDISSRDVFRPGRSSISSDAHPSSTGNAGGVEVSIVEMATIKASGIISSSTFSEGDAGSVQVHAGQLLIDGREGGESPAKISSDADFGSTGNAGNVEVTIVELATIQAGGLITSETRSEGNAGNIKVTAGQLFVDSQDIDVVTGISSETTGSLAGNAGNVEVAIMGLATIQNAGFISSSTFSEGDAGNVQVHAGQLLIDGQGNQRLTGITSEARLGSFVDSPGSAGSVDVAIEELATIRNGGVISSSTFSEGDAGSVQVHAGQLLIDGQGSDGGQLLFFEVGNGLTGISSDTAVGSGNAGDVEIMIKGLATIQNGGLISSDTFSAGDAGNVQVSAAQLLIDAQDSEIRSGISSSSLTGSTGNAGTVQVTFTEVGTIQNDGVISSSAIGIGTDSGSVIIESPGRLVIDNASITTKSLGGTAGSIEVSVGTLNTRSAEITTTTNSPTADGGNILIRSEVFVLEETVIQANAESGSGGEITVNSKAVVPFGNQLSTNLLTRVDLDDPLLPSAGNLMQAVAPTGVTVPPEINAPEVDVSGALSALDSDLGEAATIAADPCSAFQSAAPSTLVEAGRGGLPGSVASTERGITFIQNTNNVEVSFIEYASSAGTHVVDTDAIGIDESGC